MESQLTTLRVLVSRREAGAIIGKGGANVAHVREHTGVKAAVSRVTEGAVDRILTLEGTPSALGEAMVAFASSVRDANVATVKEAAAAGTDPTRLVSYDYFPLRGLNQRPHHAQVDEYSQLLFARILIPNVHTGALIGKGGDRIRAIQENHNVKLVVSKGLLHNSSERLVDVQSLDEASFEGAVVEIAEILAQEPVVSVSLYSPCASLDSSIGNAPIRSGNGPNGASSANGLNPTYATNGTNATGARGATGAKRPSRESGMEIMRKVSFPGDCVGALIGKRGARIQDVRRVSGCAVAVDTADDAEGQRHFTIIGTASNVEAAVTLLNGYYIREQGRRSLEH